MNEELPNSYSILYMVTVLTNFSYRMFGLINAVNTKQVHNSRIIERGSCI